MSESLAHRCQCLWMPLHSYYCLLNLHDLPQVSACLMYLSMSSDCLCGCGCLVCVSLCVWMLSECQNVKFSVVRSDDRSLFVVSSGHRSVGLSECQNFNRLKMPASENVCIDGCLTEPRPDWKPTLQGCNLNLSLTWPLSKHNPACDLASTVVILPWS